MQLPDETYRREKLLKYDLVQFARPVVHKLIRNELYALGQSIGRFGSNNPMEGWVKVSVMNLVVLDAALPFRIVLEIGASLRAFTKYPLLDITTPYSPLFSLKPRHCNP